MLINILFCLMVGGGRVECDGIDGGSSKIKIEHIINANYLNHILLLLLLLVAQLIHTHCYKKM